MKEAPRRRRFADETQLFPPGPLLFVVPDPLFNGVVSVTSADEVDVVGTCGGWEALASRPVWMVCFGRGVLTDTTNGVCGSSCRYSECEMVDYSKDNLSW